MEPAKLQFSPHEMNLVSNPEWILTKNEILNKVSVLMGRLNILQKEILQSPVNTLPPEIMATTPKISRGENYKGLPYLVLDYPRLFTRNNIFAVRTLFWWGKNLSTTLHLSGKWQKYFADKFLKSREQLAKNDFVISTGDHEWIHDVSAEDYSSVKNFSKTELEEMLTSRPFIKLALFKHVDELNEGIGVWKNQFEKIIEILTPQN